MVGSMQQASHIAFTGRHTAASCLSDQEWAGLPYLAENQGQLPPLVIAVDDRRWVSAAIEEIGLLRPVFLHGEVEGRRVGGVDMAIGTYCWQEGECPILVVETQIGMPASEIVLREVLTYCSSHYHWFGRTLRTNGLTVIRVGTATGINAPGLPPLNRGDIVCGTRGMGWSGTLLQSLGGLDFFAPETLDSFQGRWNAMGFGFTPDMRFPLAPCSPATIVSINTAASDLEIPLRRGGNFSIDSFYCEADTAALIELRRKYGVLTFEMEQMALMGISGLYAQAGQVLHTGIVSSITGLIPSGSDSDAAVDAELEVRSRGDALRIAARALALSAMMEQDEDGSDFAESDTD